MLDMHDHKLARLAVEFESFKEAEDGAADSFGRARDYTSYRVSRLVYFMRARELLCDFSPGS